MENKKRLAEFMGLQQVGAEDWRWIMSVVEKIEGLGAHTVIGWNGSSYWCSIHINSKQFIANNTTSRIEAVNGAVDKFLEWHLS